MDYIRNFSFFRIRLIYICIYIYSKLPPLCLYVAKVILFISKQYCWYMIHNTLLRYLDAIRLPSDLVWTRMTDALAQTGMRVTNVSERLLPKQGHTVLYCELFSPTRDKHIVKLKHGLHAVQDFVVIVVCWSLWSLSIFYKLAWLPSTSLIYLIQICKSIIRINLIDHELIDRNYIYERSGLINELRWFGLMHQQTKSIAVPLRRWVLWQLFINTARKRQKSMICNILDRLKITWNTIWKVLINKSIFSYTFEKISQIVNTPLYIRRI